MKEKYNFSGKHILGELYDIEYTKLNSFDLILECIEKGTMSANATLLGVQIKKFCPSGMTILALLSESHISIHTYPKNKALFLDVFTCGEKCNPKIIIDQIIKDLEPSKVTLKEIRRGQNL